MDVGDDEPEDWPPSHEAARALDSALRCQICRQLLDTPLRASCPHAFCSECLRAWIGQRLDAQCPSCREPLDAQQLRTDPLLNAIADAFRRARPGLLSAVTAPAQQPPVASREPRRVTRSSLRGRGEKLAAASLPLPEEVDLVAEEATGTPSQEVVTIEDDDFMVDRPPAKKGHASAPPHESKGDSKFGECFICHAQVRKDLMNDHVNRCLDKQLLQQEDSDMAPGKPSAVKQPNMGTGETPKPRPAADRGGASCVRHPPVMVTHIMGLKELTSLCTEWGLIHQGEKVKSTDLLKRRWAAFYQKSLVHRDKADITGQHPDYGAAAREILRDERARSCNSQVALAFFAGPGAAGGPKARSSDDKAALFDQLIESTRARGHKGGPPKEFKRAAVEEDTAAGSTQEERPAKRARGPTPPNARV